MNTSLAVGDIIADGKYILEKELGEGGLAVVYKVRHAQLDTPFAIKILKVTLPSLQDRLIVEGQLQAQLQHPNVVKVTDVIKVDGFPALVMEFIDGIALDDYLNETPPSIQEAEDMFLQILDAVEEAHDRGIIHRDLKPANVMMQRTRTKFIPKVCDFGLGKNLAKEGQTRTGQQMGTPAYMAPEQIRSTKDVDQRADIFSLGAILYELLTGHRAFKGSNTLDLLNAVASQPHATPRLYIQDLEERYVQAIDGALAKNAQFRIPDCATFRRVLLGEETWVTERTSLNSGGGNTDTLMSLGLDLMGDGDTAVNLGADQQIGTLPSNNSLISERRVHQLHPESHTQAPQHTSNTLNNFEASAPPVQSSDTPTEAPKSKNGLIGIAVALLLIVGGVGYTISQSKDSDGSNEITSVAKSTEAVENTNPDAKDDKSTDEVATETQSEEANKPVAKPTTEPNRSATKQSNDAKTTTTKTTSTPKQTTATTVKKSEPTKKVTTRKPVVEQPVEKPIVKTPVKEPTASTTSAGPTGTIKLLKAKGYLKQGGKRFSTGTAVPVGQYSIILQCESDEIDVGYKSVRENKTDTYTCDCGFQSCR